MLRYLVWQNRYLKEMWNKGKKLLSVDDRTDCWEKCHLGAIFSVTTQRLSLYVTSWVLKSLSVVLLSTNYLICRVSSDDLILRITVWHEMRLREPSLLAAVWQGSMQEIHGVMTTGNGCVASMAAYVLYFRFYGGHHISYENLYYTRTHIR